jgi:iron complex outermembrane receptor protein
VRLDLRFGASERGFARV